jgi:hypothetical protein
MDMAGHTSTQVAKGYRASADDLIDHVADWPRHDPPQFYIRRDAGQGAKSAKDAQ